MKEKLLFYLSGLNRREKVLLAVATLLLGGFLGMKMSQSVLEAFFDYDLTALSEQKRQAQESKALYVGIQAQKKELDSLNKLILHFKADEKAYLDELYALANGANVDFTSIKNTTTKDAAFAKHSIFIDFESDLASCLAFLQAVEHSKFFFEFSELKIARNDSTKTLRTFLHLRFISVLPR